MPSAKRNKRNPPSKPGASSSHLPLAICALIALTLIAYYNSLANNFVWDDHQQIVMNPTLVRFTDYPPTDGVFEGHEPEALGLTTHGQRPGDGRVERRGEAQILVLAEAAVDDADRGRRIGVLGGEPCSTAFQVVQWLGF